MSSLIKYIIYLTTSTRVFPAPLGLNYNYNFRFLYLGLLFLILASVVILQSPVFILLIMFSLSIIPLLSLFPSHWQISFFTGIMLDNVLQFLLSTGALKFFYIIYVFWHQCLTFKGFKFFYTALYTMVLLYIITVRYIFYLKISFLTIPFWIYGAYFITFLFVILKTLTETSFFLIKTICTKFPKYKELLASEMPEELDLNLGKNTTPSNNSKIRFGGFLNFHFHRHRHIYPPELPQNKFATYAKFGFALLGLGFTGLAGYNYHRTADAAVRSADAAIRSADAAVRSADLSAYQQGLITKDEYYRRQPQDKLS